MEGNNKTDKDYIYYKGKVISKIKRSKIKGKKERDETIWLYL